MKLKLITTESFGTVPCDFYRNMNDHFCKMAAFSTNIQQFFKDYFGDDYYSATVKDMFGNEHYVMV